MSDNVTLQRNEMLSLPIKTRLDVVIHQTGRVCCVGEQKAMVESLPGVDVAARNDLTHSIQILSLMFVVVAKCIYYTVNL